MEDYRLSCAFLNLTVALKKVETSHRVLQAYILDEYVLFFASFHVAVALSRTWNILLGLQTNIHEEEVVSWPVR